MTPQPYYDEQVTAKAIDLAEAAHVVLDKADDWAVYLRSISLLVYTVANVIAEHSHSVPGATILSSDQVLSDIFDVAKQLNAATDKAVAISN